MNSRASLTPTHLLLALGFLACGGEVESDPTADLVLHNGKIVTMDPGVPVGTALAITGDRVSWVGEESHVERWIDSDTEVIDLAGRLAVPGLIEGHAHFVGLGEALAGVDLLDTQSWDEVLARVEQATRELPPGTWIVGRGWHQSKWDTPARPSVRGFPGHDALSAVSPDHPVALGHASGHAILANARAMREAGVDRTTPSPPGGEILHYEDGSPSGVFIENAEDLIDGAFARWLEQLPETRRRERLREQIRLANDEALRNGITTFQDAGASPEEIEAYHAAIAADELDVRLWVMLSEAYATPETLERLRQTDDPTNRLTVRAIKAYSDGALGSRGAWLLEPYADDPGNTGLNTVPMPRIRAVADTALMHGYQLCTHAIGDRANREVLDVYEAALAANPDAALDARFRIEHAQILHPDDVQRFASLGVIAAMQGIHAVSDGPWTPERLGEERTNERAFPFRNLLDAGVVVMNGTDAPVERVDPIASYSGAVTGLTSDGEVFVPHHLMTREEGLRSYTISAAYGAHEEDNRGSLTPGKLADVTVLSRDILTVPDEQVAGAKPVMTIVGGRIVWEAEGTEAEE
ncbi:MAG: amidohydrolase [marine benthic group bacterium]|nr:amidohydrolase [Gemmatimonadota bacterium]